MTDETAATVTEGTAATPPATGTPPATDRNAESIEDENRRLKAALEQSKAEKNTLEQTKAERDALARQIEVMSSQPPTQGVDPVIANVQARYQELLWLAQQGDTDAQFRIAQIHGQQVALERIQRNSELALLGDLRPKVEKVLAEHPTLTVQLAKEFVEGNEARARAKEYEDKAAEAKRQAEEAARGSTAGVTSVRSAPATEVSRGSTMKASEFNSRMAALNERISQGDKAARAEALKLGRQIDSGEVSLILNQ